MNGFKKNEKKNFFFLNLKFLNFTVLTLEQSPCYLFLNVFVCFLQKTPKIDVTDGYSRPTLGRKKSQSCNALEDMVKIAKIPESKDVKLSNPTIKILRNSVDKRLYAFFERIFKISALFL